MKTLNCGIYAFLNQVTGLRYIGQSRNLENRRKEHLNSLHRGDHHSQYLQRSYRLHGAESLIYSVLEYCNADAMTDREQFWLDFYTSAGVYNSAPAANSNLGVVWSAESRQKQSKSQKGRIHSEETKDKIRLAHLGRKFSEIHVENMRLTRLGKVHTEESREKMSKARKGRKFSPEHIANMNICKVGRKHTVESIEKMRLAKIGRKASPEAKAKISASLTGKVRSAESNRKMVETRQRNKLLKQAETI